MADEDGQVGLLFEQVVFTIIPSDNIDDTSTQNLIATLEHSGGRHVPLRNLHIDEDNFDNVTHIISTHVDFPQYNRAVDSGISVVKPSWVVSSVMKQRQCACRQHSPDPSQFMQEVNLTCAGLPEGDVDSIAAGVIAMGGQYTLTMSKLVTHIATLDMDTPKVRVAQDKGLNCKVVLPHWFDDCFRLGKKINERPYMFPHPELLRNENKGSVRIISSPHLDGATSASPTDSAPLSPPPSPSKTRKTLNAFKGRKIFLSEDLDISEHLKGALQKVIIQGEGSVTDDLDEAHIYIGQYRDGHAYVTASRTGKEVASLSWLYHVINQNRYTSPLRRLFHYPIPREGIKGFENMKISLSNYSGEARVYVENLIRYCGAEYTKTMKTDNTHLITANKAGSKCEAAQEWNINVVNHLWLEESYVKCAIQSMTNPKYTHFPARTNLGEVTGQTSLDMKSIERIFYPKPRSPQKQATMQKSSPRKNLPDSSIFANCSAVNTGADDPVSPVETDEMDIELPAPATVKRPRGRPSRSATETPRHLEEEKENESPMLTSTGRVSKMRARDSLRSQAEDIAEYKKEEKRKGGVIYGGLRSRLAEQAASPAPQSKGSRKRPSDEYDVTAQGSDLSDGETQDAPPKQSKKVKHSSAPALPPVKYRMMVTGDDRWADNAKKESADKATLRSLGVLLTQEPKDVDILVAPKILRTRKFVSALACAPLVVDTSFLDTAISKKKLVDPPPLLKDHDNEGRLGFTLVDALERAKQNNRKLFRSWSVFITKQVNGGFDTYKDIISLNGGEAMMYVGRPNAIVPTKPNSADRGAESQNQGEADEYDYVYLVSGRTDEEVKLWRKFRENAEKQGLEPRVVTSDWVLNAAMSQRISLQDKWVLNEDEVISQRNG